MRLSASDAFDVNASPIKPAGSSLSPWPNDTSNRYSFVPSRSRSSHASPQCSTHIQYPSSAALNLDPSSPDNVARTMPLCASANANALRSGMTLACLCRSSPMYPGAAHSGPRSPAAKHRQRYSLVAFRLAATNLRPDSLTPTVCRRKLGPMYDPRLPPPTPRPTLRL